LKVDEDDMKMKKWRKDEEDLTFLN